MYDTEARVFVIINNYTDINIKTICTYIIVLKNLGAICILTKTIQFI